MLQNKYKKAQSILNRNGFTDAADGFQSEVIQKFLVSTPFYTNLYTKSGKFQLYSCNF